MGMYRRLIQTRLWNDYLLRCNTPMASSVCWLCNGSLEAKKPTKVDQVSVVPHPVSRLRLYQFCVPANETNLERRLRERRSKLQEMNHEFWSQINIEFNEKKKAYIQSELKNRVDTDYTSSQTHEELGQFYKKFLNDHHQRYINYNIAWYKENVSLLWPSFLVALIRLRRNLTSGLKQ